jgi:hypothetical protein
MLRGAFHARVECGDNPRSDLSDFKHTATIFPAKFRRSVAARFRRGRFFCERIFQGLSLGEAGAFLDAPS